MRFLFFRAAVLSCLKNATRDNDKRKKNKQQLLRRCQLLSTAEKKREAEDLGFAFPDSSPPHEKKQKFTGKK